jgi:hypothetical protein
MTDAAGNTIFTNMWTFLVNLVATFIADVLAHPKVHVALEKVIVSGMNATMEQPDLSRRIQMISATLQEDNRAMSRSLGEQFPTMASSFVKGAVAGMRKSTKSVEIKKDE